MPTISGVVEKGFIGSGIFVPGVAVRVFDSALTTLLASTLTNAVGSYLIDMTPFGPGTYTVRGVKAGWTGFPDTPVIPPAVLNVAMDGTDPAKECFSPAFSTWVHEVCWIPLQGVRITYHKNRVPYFACIYPGTAYADYLAFKAAASAGKWVWAFYWLRPYVPVPLNS